jgi:HTH-type transcriptional regulator/antitoxin MqsA
MKAKRFCLQCDDGTLLEHGARDLSFTRHTRTHTVPQVWGWHCPVCADCQFDDNEVRSPHRRHCDREQKVQAW